MEKTKITKIAKAYSETQQNLHKKLKVTFKADLKKWRASLEEDNTIRFYAPDVLFKSGSSEISSEFKNILNNFFPKYVDILTNGKFKNDIEEVRIEGHTSSEWAGARTSEQRYLANLNLSQHRSFEVLKYCLSILKNHKEREWLKGVFQANGVSFAKPILKADGTEDKMKSRRVEFRVIVKSKERIEKILEMANEEQRKQK